MGKGDLNSDCPLEFIVEEPGLRTFSRFEILSREVNRSGVFAVKKRIVYQCPPSHVINKYAREVCEQLGQKLDSSYNAPGMSDELARFLKVVATICAKALNTRAGSTRSQD